MGFFGGGGGGGTVGPGSTNAIAKFTGATAVGNSRVSDDGTTIDANSGTGVFQAGDTALAANGSFLKIDDTAKTVALIADDNNSSDGFSVAPGTLSLRVASSTYRVFLNSTSGQSAIVANATALTLDDPNTAIIATTPIFRGQTNGVTDLGTAAVGFKQAFFDATIIPPGTTGAQAINKSAGSVNFAAAASSLVVTCNKCTTSSIVIATVATNDTTLKSVQAVAANGSFTLFANAAATAETRVNFWVLN